MKKDEVKDLGIKKHKVTELKLVDKAESSDLLALVPGDICFASTDEFAPQDFAHRGNSQFPRVKTEAELAAEAEDFDSDDEDCKHIYHTWGFIGGNSGVAHAVNTGINGVTSHTLQTIMKAMSDNVGGTIVLGSKDALLSSNIAKIISSFLCLYNPEEVKKIKSKQWQGLLYTTYAEHGRAQDKDDKDIATMKTMLRSFRVYFRSQSNQPVSKKQGVKCSIFMGYCIQAGLIARFFDKEFLATLQSTVDALTKIGLKKVTKGTPELAKLEVFYLAVLEQMVIQNKAGEDFLGLGTTGMWDLLTYNTKNTSAEELYKFLSNYPIFAFKGLLVLTEKAPSSQASSGYDAYAVSFNKFSALHEAEQTLAIVHKDHTALLAALDTPPKVKVKEKQSDRVVIQAGLWGESARASETAVGQQGDQLKPSLPSNTPESSDGESLSSSDSEKEDLFSLS